MDRALRNFDKRQREVTARHRRLAQGYVTKVNRNGTIEHKPIRRVRASGISVRLALLAGLCFFVFKAFLLAGLGAEEYALRIGHLANGTLIERAGAWLMGADPVTTALATLILPYLS
ncbi:hypothetical protein [Salipiger abyssi]|uniref:hypothetical protein n=1 Tax=Salipiger abyssi TaxID=1250539 RepID=UPI004057E0A3